LNINKDYSKTLSTARQVRLFIDNFIQYPMHLRCEDDLKIISKTGKHVRLRYG